MRLVSFFAIQTLQAADYNGARYGIEYTVTSTNKNYSTYAILTRKMVQNQVK